MYLINLNNFEENHYFLFFSTLTVIKIWFSISDPLCSSSPNVAIRIKKINYFIHYQGKENIITSVPLHFQKVSSLEANLMENPTL